MAGDDVLTGGGDRDTIWGGNGNDTISGAGSGESHSGEYKFITKFISEIVPRP